jgi:hypothetical protein
MRKQKRKKRPSRKGIPDCTQLVIDACNVKVKEKIMQYEALVEEVVGTSVNDTNDDNDDNRPSSIVVSEAEDALQPCSSNRNSILSNSSIDSTRSDDVVDRNIQLGSSVFYVVWD